MTKPKKFIDPIKVDYYDRISNLPADSVTCIMKFGGKVYSLGFFIKDYKEHRDLMKCLMSSAQATLDIEIPSSRKDWSYY